MIKIAVAGASGRMGQAILKVMSQDPHTELAGTLTRSDAQLSPANVLIDFSVKAAIREHIELCLQSQTPLVLGVTGLESADWEVLHSASKKIPIVYDQNMSIGVNVSLKLLEIATQHLQAYPTLDMGIEEIHHRGKKDAPSGTALKMRQILTKALTESKSKCLTTRQDEIPIASLRIGEVPGEHRVWFSLANEQIILSHHAKDRIIFAEGAVQAAKWLVKQPPKLYDMQDVLGLKE